MILEFAEPYKGWTFFAVAGFGHGTCRPLSTSAPVALSQLLGDNYSTRRMGVVVYAIPDDVLDEIGSPAIDPKWHDKHEDDPRVRRAGFGLLSISTTYADPRGRVIETHRVTLTPTALETELVSSKEEYGSGVLVCGACLAFVVGLIWCLVWCIRRLFRRKAVTRTTPPPGN